ncbi:MAG TPA: MFS transporter [Blastocatellia bacterium]
MSANDLTQSERKGGGLSALRHRDFKLYFFGQLISVTGSQMQLAAINWHIYTITKSRLALGGVGLVRVVPIILCSLVGGAVADAVDRKNLMKVTQSIMLACAVMLSVITAHGLHHIWPIYLLTAIASGAIAFDSPARQSLLPMLVPEDDFPNAVSLGLIAFQLSTVIGPMVAGVLLGVSGPAIIYALNAVSFLGVIVAVFLIRASGAPGAAPSEAPMVSLAAIREGLRFVWRTPIIVQTMTLDFVATFFASATALLPVFAAEILKVGPRGYGLLTSASAIGSVISAFVMARLGTIKHQGRTVLIAIGIYGAATIGFGVSRIYWLSLTMLALVGASDTVSTVLRQTIRQLVTPNYLRGRMTSVNMVFFMGGPQLGEMEAGTVAQFLGAPWSVISGGIGCVLAVLIAAFKAKNLLAYIGAREYRGTEAWGSNNSQTSTADD